MILRQTWPPCCCNRQPRTVPPQEGCPWTQGPSARKTTLDFFGDNCFSDDFDFQKENGGNGFTSGSCGFLWWQLLLGGIWFSETKWWNGVYLGKLCKVGELIHWPCWKLFHLFSNATNVIFLQKKLVFSEFVQKLFHPFFNPFNVFFTDKVCFLRICSKLFSLTALSCTM